DRVEIYAKQVQNGLKTRGECRQLENDDPLPGDDVLTVQSNLLPIDMLGKQNGGSNAAPSQNPIAQ
ncbi:MAG TPA: phage portal protein, partial [Aquabacterium sp.]|nr:phage portal protein [Aquabacterium sp.]